MSSSIQTPPGNPLFVSELDSKHKCDWCHNVLSDAMQTKCGHRICDHCINPMFEGKTGKIKCPANDEDCELLERGDAHAGTCKFKPVDCPYLENGCTEKFPHGKMDKHKENCEYRLVSCTHCKKLVPLKMHEDHVTLECSAVPRTCPFKCGAKPMNREELTNHVAECTNRPQECPYSSVGCEFKGRGEESERHLKDATNSHLQMTVLYARNTEVSVLALKRTIQDLNTKIQRLEKQISDSNAQVERLSTASKDSKLKMVNITERVIHLEKMTETTAKKEMVDQHDRDLRAMQTTVTQLRAQSSSLERLTVQAQQAASQRSDATGVPELRGRVSMHDSQFANIDIQMAELDLRFQILETACYDGTLLWKVRDYARRKQDAVTGRTLSLYSQPFYTHRYGYKMCARVYLNGDGMGKGSHLSLFFVIMKGEYDNLLPWPFQQKVTMVLLDQDSGQCHLTDSFRPDPTSSSFRKPTTDMNIASGCPLFVSHTVLETPKYVKDDVVMLKFMVDLTNLNHP